MLSNLAKASYCIYTAACTGNLLSQIAGIKHPLKSLCDRENSDGLQKFVNEAAEKMGIRKPVTLVESEKGMMAFGINLFSIFPALIAVPKEKNFTAEGVGVGSPQPFKPLKLNERKILLLHELAHIRNNDALVLLIPVITSIALFIILKKRYPILGSLVSSVHLAASLILLLRSRERKADMTAAKYASIAEIMAGHSLWETYEQVIQQIEKINPNIRAILKKTDFTHPEPRERAKIFLKAFREKVRAIKE